MGNFTYNFNFTPVRMRIFLIFFNEVFKAYFVNKSPRQAKPRCQVKIRNNPMATYFPLGPTVYLTPEKVNTVNILI